LGRHFVVARGAGCESERVVLLAPDGEAVGGFYLAGEDTMDSALKTFGGVGAGGLVEETELFCGGGDVVEKFHDVAHGVVVVSDGVVVAALEGPDLRPAAVGILGVEDVVDPAAEGGDKGLCGFCVGRVDDFCKEAELGDGGVVVESADVIPLKIRGGVVIGVA